MKRKYLHFAYPTAFAFFLIGTFFSAAAQTDSLPSGKIEADPSINGINFSTQLPTLTGFPGGRAPYYTYFWDLGDGHFSMGKQPIHSYSDSGKYTVKLYATNNYDPGKRPPRPVKQLNIVSPADLAVESTAEESFWGNNEVFKLGKNTNAMPGTDLVLIAGVKPVAVGGKVYILSNEKIFDAPGFAVVAQSHYNEEQPIADSAADNMPLYALSDIRSITLTRSGSPDYGAAVHKNFTEKKALSFFKALYSSYQSVTAYEITGQQGQPQFSFLRLAIKPEMLKDTNAMVTLTGIYIPDNGTQAYVHRLDIPVVASHDPNRMSLKQTRLNYRTTFGRKRLTYKVQFQNDGKGDAKNIRLELTLPSIMDRSSFKLLNIYPHIPPCSDSAATGCWYSEPKGEDSLFFYFKGIRLPGSQAADEVAYDSTQGFIRFSMKSAKHLPNKPFKGRTAIFFDHNEPVITNGVTGKFRKSLSPIVFLGYNYVTAGEGTSKSIEIPFNYSKNLELGIGLSPLAPYKKLFWQVELRASYYEQQANQPDIAREGEVQIDSVWYGYRTYDLKHHRKNLRLRLSALPLKYNLNGWLSVGAGVEANININLSNEEETVYHTVSRNGTIPRSVFAKLTKDTRNPLHLRPFADVNVGSVYLGPSLGLRYYVGIKDFSSLGAYLCWRF